MREREGSARRRWAVVVCLCVVVLLMPVGCMVLARSSDRGPDELTVWGYRGDGFYGAVSGHGLKPLRYVRSADGGATWSTVADKPADRVPLGFYSDIEKCAPDGVCYRYNQEGFVLERGNADDGWEVELTVPGPRQLACLDVNPSDSGQVVVQVSHTEVAYRTIAGTWQTVDVVAVSR